MRLLITLLALTASIAANATSSRPNILWITLEDVSADLGCYGNDYANTPRIDALATQGLRYSRCWANAGMCAVARATLITGMYPPSTSAQNMRSRVTLPESIKAYSQYFREAGYYCSNHTKTDYNWEAPSEAWDSMDANWRQHGWNGRSGGQPFFTVINITDTHSSQIYWRGEEKWKRRYEALAPAHRHDPDQAPVPPFYPDTPAFRADIARYYDNLSYADLLVGEILDQLEADGLAEDTIVFLYSDHGRGMPRTKGWCFETSLRVPFIVRMPERFQALSPAEPGSTIDRLVSFVDFAPTAMELCQIDIPDNMQGVPFLGNSVPPAKPYAFAYRDRMDERVDLIRAVTDGRYKYIRNYLPHLPWFHHQTRQYPSTQPSYLIWHQMANTGELSGDAAIYMARERPREQLFDLESDPYELNDLAEDPAHAAKLEELRRALRDWQDEILDLGFMPESEWSRIESQGDLRSRHTIARESADRYPLDTIRETAEWVGDGPQHLGAQLRRLTAPHPATRYWAALGILASHDETDPKRLRPALQKAMRDTSYSVQIVAAETLCRLGDSQRSLDTLIAALHHPKPYISLQAANALDHLDTLALPARPRIEAFLAGDGPVGDGDNFPAWTLQKTFEHWDGK